MTLTQCRTHDTHGELIGYGLRIVSGVIGHRTPRYWAITIAGYVVNLLAYAKKVLKDAPAPKGGKQPVT